MVNQTGKLLLRGGHGIRFIVSLCLFGLCMAQVLLAQRNKKKTQKKDRVELLHADELRYDLYGPSPEVQVLKGHVSFRHQGARLTCDSAYFYETDNSIRASRHVRFRQGDIPSLTADRADYDGQKQVMRARKNVVLKHRRQILCIDSLDCDRLYKSAYFFEGGALIDRKDRLVSDWGEYNTETRQTVFYYNMKLKSPERVVTTDTLHYDTRKSIARMLGPFKITTKSSVVETKGAFFHTKSDQAQLYDRSTIMDGEKTITDDSLFYDSRTGDSHGNGNVVFVDKKNRNSLMANYLQYNEKTGQGVATDSVLVIDYSQKDTLYMHGDTLKLSTFHIDTNSIYRRVYAHHKMRVYRKDFQAVCDSLVFSMEDSCMTMYQDPITWNNNRQLLGERIHLYMNDSTIREAHVIGQALSTEQADQKDHYSQLLSKEMYAYFTDGNIRRTIAVSNVLSVFYPVDDKGSSLVMMNYLGTDTMEMYFTDHRRLEKIWTPRAMGTSYPMSQIPANKERLPDFAWFADVRPKDKDDVFHWRGREGGNKLKYMSRQQAPLQRLNRKREATP